MVANIAHLRLTRKSFYLAISEHGACRIFLTNGTVMMLCSAPDATSRFDDLVTLEWSRRWPCEEIWKARRRA